MEIAHTIDALRARLDADRRRGAAIAFVPTMGNLHEGHAALMREAGRHGSPVVASIFVNRLQFGPREDFDRYPRTFDADCQVLRACGVDCLFAPDEATVYPEPQSYLVELPALAERLEGEFRPGFFRGVTTVVLKLFNAVQPAAAVFGKKDYQQLAIVRGMVRQFALPIAIMAAETVRAADGLALSSRNGYLSLEERKRAPLLHRVLQETARALRAGERDFARLEAQAMARLDANRWKPDYVAVRTQAALESPDLTDTNLVVLAAASLGTTRLIDNVEVFL